MVDGPLALVLDQWAGAAERVARSRALPVAMSRGTHGLDVGSGCGCRAVEEDNHAFPVVAMAETRRWRVLGHVPEPSQ